MIFYNHNQWAEIRSKGKEPFLWGNPNQRFSTGFVIFCVIIAVVIFHGHAGLLSAEFLEYLGVGVGSAVVSHVIAVYATWLYNESCFKKTANNS